MSRHEHRLLPLYKDIHSHHLDHRHRYRIYNVSNKFQLALQHDTPAIQNIKKKLCSRTIEISVGKNNKMAIRIKEKYVGGQKEIEMKNFNYITIKMVSLL